MIYLSKGILPWKPQKDKVSVSHCGVLYNLSGMKVGLWLDGRFKIGHIGDNVQKEALAEMSRLSIAECNDREDDTAIFRLLINCIICPVKVNPSFAKLTRMERFVWTWIRKAGLRLTMAELTALAERGVEPVPELLGEDGRQALTETLYMADTIPDGILETLMEKSPVRDETVRAVLGLLKKKKIYLI